MFIGQAEYEKRTFTRGQHCSHYVPGLMRATSGRGISILQANSASCAPFFDLSQPVLLNCDPLNVFVRRRLHIDPPDVVLISANWRSFSEALGYDCFLTLLRATIDELITYT